MKIAVCDDEKAQRELVEKYIAEWGEATGRAVRTFGFANSAAFLFHWEDDRDFDLLVLDIEMPGEYNGVALAQKLRKENAAIPILFVTGFEQYMAQGYEVEALHYLIKPLRRDKLFAVLERAVKKRPPEKELLFRTKDGLTACRPSDIWYIEAQGHHSVLHTADAAHTLTEGIGAVRGRFLGSAFLVPCHRGLLVNLQHVSAIERQELALDDGERLPVSRGLAKDVQRAFIRWYRAKPVDESEPDVEPLDESGPKAQGAAL